MTSTLSELWSTPVWLGTSNAKLIQSAVGKLLATKTDQPRTSIPPETVLTDPAGMTTDFLRAIGAATAHTEVTAKEVTIEIDLLTAGHSVGLAYGTGDWMAWCVLAAAGATGSPSGMLSLHDPRAGSAAADVPGAPWGRPLTIKPEPGITAVFPGWLGYSITPVDPGHRILAAAVVINAVSLEDPS